MNHGNAMRRQHAENARQAQAEQQAARPMFAHFSLTRLGGVNIKQPVSHYKGRSVYVADPQEPGRMYRLDAAKFIAGERQYRDSSWAIRRWDDRAERQAQAEANWQT